MAEFLMPSLGADMDDGVLVEWRVKVGDRVERGDIVAVVQTQKAAIEVEIFSSGTIESIVVDEGTKVPVGTVLATISSATDEREEAAPLPEAATASEENSVPDGVVAWPSAVPPLDRRDKSIRRRISPAARRRARQLGIDANALAKGDEAVRLADVEAAARAQPKVSDRAGKQEVGGESRQAEEQGAERIRLVRAATAAAMSRAKREIPHYYLSHTIDLQRAMLWLESTNRDRAPADRLLPVALLLKATALALRDVPELNGFYREQRFHPAAVVNLGVGISLRGGGVVAPAIHDTDNLELTELMAKLRDLVTRTRAARLRSSELADGTATVSSLGDHGVDTVFGVIYPPQVALIGFGGIVRRAWAVDELIGVHPVVRVTLAADHRASEGHRGSLFLRSIEDFLAEPESL